MHLFVLTVSMFWPSSYPYVSQYRYAHFEMCIPPFLVSCTNCLVLFPSYEAVGIEARPGRSSMRERIVDMYSAVDSRNGF